MSNHINSITVDIIPNKQKTSSLKAHIALCMLVLIICQCSAGPKETEFVATTLVPTSTSTRTPTPTIEPTVTPTTTSTPTETATPTFTLTPMNPSTPTTTLQAITNGDCIPLDTKREIGVVKSITGGDTIVVEIDGVVNKVRYIGIDSPEPSDGELGISASNANKDLVLGKEVVLIKDVSGVDNSDRLLRYVVVENTFVNEYLVRIGMASAVSNSPDVSCDNALQEAQSSAENNQYGMWSSAYIDPGSRSITPTSVSLCNCSIDYDCGDFSTHSAAQACFESCGGSKTYDWSALDRDGDGYACESLP